MKKSTFELKKESNYFIQIKQLRLKRVINIKLNGQKRIKYKATHTICMNKQYNSIQYNL
jgi:hypothetical protein